MTTILSKTFNFFKNFYTGMGTSDNPPMVIPGQLYGDGEDQEVAVRNGEGIQNQVAKTDNALDSEDSKPSFSRSNTDLSPRKGSFHQSIRKPDRRTRKDRAPTNSCSQCVTAAKETVELKRQLEAGRQDLAKVNKQSVESERLLGEK